MYNDDEYESDWGETMSNSINYHNDNHLDGVKFLYDLPKAAVIVAGERTKMCLNDVKEFLSDKED
jgi:hypothetical protein